MNAIYVSAEPGPGMMHDGKQGMSPAECDPEKVIAITLLQSPLLATIEDEKWEENAKFIAEAREALPYWLQRVKELEGALKLAYKALTEGMKDVPTEACDPQCAKIRVEAKKAIRKALKRMTENDRARNIERGSRG